MRTAAYIVAIVGMLATAAAIIARLVPITNHVVLPLAVLSPYLTAGAATAAALLVIARRWLTAAVAIALTVAAIAVELPLFTRTAPNQGATVRVFTANVREGHADPKPLLDIANHKADVVVLEELTPELGDALDRNGIRNTFPYQTLDPGEDGVGVGIWSRFPITSSERIEGYRLKMVSAYITVPGIKKDTVFVATHLAGPWPQDIGPWHEEIQNLRVTLGTITEQAGASPVIVAGDFNATYDMACPQPAYQRIRRCRTTIRCRHHQNVSRRREATAAHRDRSRPDLPRHSHRRTDRQSPRLRSPGTARDGQPCASSRKFRVMAGSTGMPGPVVVDTVIFFR